MASKKKVPADGPDQQDSSTPPPAQPPVDLITKLELYLEKNWRKVVILLSVVVAGVIVYFYTKYKKEDEMTVSNNAFTSATTRSDFEAVMKDHPGTAAAGSALFEIADRQLAASETAAAKATLEKFIADFPKHPLYYNALLGLGSICEQLGETDKADGYFAQVVEAGDKSPLAPLATIHRAELLVGKGELTKAKEIYDTFGPDYKGDPFVQKASERLAALEVRIKREAAPEAPVEPEPEPEPKPEIKPIPPTPGGANKPVDPAPAGTTDPAPEGTTDPAPEGTTDPAPEGATDPAPEGTTDPAPEGTTDPAPEGTTDPAPEGTTDPAPEGTTDPAPEGTDDPAPEGTTDPAPEGTADPAADE